MCHLCEPTNSKLTSPEHRSTFSLNYCNTVSTRSRRRMISKYSHPRKKTVNFRNLPEKNATRLGDMPLKFFSVAPWSGGYINTMEVVLGLRPLSCTRPCFQLFRAGSKGSGCARSKHVHNKWTTFTEWALYGVGSGGVFVGRGWEGRP